MNYIEFISAKKLLLCADDYFSFENIDDKTRLCAKIAENYLYLKEINPDPIKIMFRMGYRD